MNKTIKYQDIATLCTKLEQDGYPIALRSIRLQLGGSFSFISACLQRWQQEKLQIRTQHQISAILQADLSDGSICIENILIVGLKEQLTCKKELSQEMLAVLSSLEKDAERSLSKTSKLEQNLAIVKRRLKEALKKVRTLEHSYQKVIQETEVIKTERKQVKICFDKAKKRGVELNDIIRRLEITAYNAELRAVKAEGRLLDMAK